MSDLPSPPPPGDDALDAVGVLADPVRRALYRYVAAAEGPVGRAAAADAVGIQRTLAAFHLDKLVEARLLSTEFARPAGRSGGPGAGRPAKLYRRSAVETSVTLPPRAYDTAGQILADAVERAGAARAVDAAAYDTGRVAGRTLGGPAGEGADEHNRVVAALTARGYEPVPVRGHDAVPGPGRTAVPEAGHEPGHAAGTEGVVPGTAADESRDASRILLRNCPFHRLAEDFPPLVCGMNLALLEGLLDGLGATGYRARLDSVPGRCCVVVERATETDREGSAD
ncbi:helix-turn-helix transcriptional regulator [Embleya scabrispora]|uniref:helix-turn-helix transcriptional regulator n=1 Tax=Embleya scabrispora TaxID=159449 RepID=UPI000381F1EE|nr:helix-turn-helix domain-containing protein [Embleya scabrispora]MYS87452.1 transcriptional regulator [Streptomyces sp. SID5474]